MTFSTIVRWGRNLFFLALAALLVFLGYTGYGVWGAILALPVVVLGFLALAVGYIVVFGLFVGGLQEAKWLVETRVFKMVWFSAVVLGGLIGAALASSRRDVWLLLKFAAIGAWSGAMVTALPVSLLHLPAVVRTMREGNRPGGAQGADRESSTPPPAGLVPAPARTEASAPVHVAGESASQQEDDDAKPAHVYEALASKALLLLFGAVAGFLGTTVLPLAQSRFSTPPQCAATPTTKLRFDPLSDRWCKDVPDGPCLTEGGTKAYLRGECRNGKMIGSWIAVGFDGALRWAGAFKDGNADGAWVEAADEKHVASGQRSADDYGSRTGTWVTWNEEEGIWWRGRGGFSKHERQGDWTEVAENGKCSRSGGYKDGKREGNWIDRRNHIVHLVKFTNGAPRGRFLWNEEGEFVGAILSPDDDKTIYQAVVKGRLQRRELNSGTLELDDMVVQKVFPAYLRFVAEPCL